MNQTTEQQHEEAEASGMYSKEVLFDRKTYQKIVAKAIKIDPHEGFRKTYLDMFKRKNIQYFGTIVQEQSIPGSIAAGQVELPLITLEQVKRKLRSIPEKDRNKIGYIHFGAVRIHIKASFQKGLDTPITLTLMHNRIINREEALIGILRGNLMYQNLGFTTYPGYGIPIKDLDTNRALNLCYHFQRIDLLESLHHSPFTIYTMVSYMLSNTHMIDKFLNKDEIEIDDIFSDICEVQPNSHTFIPAIQPVAHINLQPKPLLGANPSIHRRYSVDGSTLRFHSSRFHTPTALTAVYQLISKLYITEWSDGLVWINPALQQNFVGQDLYPRIQQHKVTYLPLLLGSTEQIIHFETDPLPSKADLILGRRFLTTVTYSQTAQVLTIKTGGSLIQAIRIHD
jgi:hypothetical protein